MRYSFALVLAFTVCSVAQAQLKDKFKPPEIKKVHVGFKTYKEEDQTAYKVGLWTPVYIEVFGGSDGIEMKRTYNEPPHLEIVTGDSDDVGTSIIIGPVLVEPMKERTFIGYVKTGHQGHMNSREVKVTLHIGNRELKPFTHEPGFNLNVDAHMYLTLGPRITDFHKAARKIGQHGVERDPNDVRFDPTLQHHVGYESDVERLPTMWFGYNSVDLAILGTDKREFLTKLNQETDRLKALAQWVRRGGRLVVPIDVKTQDAVHALLKNEAAWQPPIPVVPPKGPSNLAFDHLLTITNWAGVQGDVFKRDDNRPIPVAMLDPGNVAPGDWDVLVSAGQKPEDPPLIARVRYGLGQITYIAFSLQDENFFQWKGKEKFLQSMVDQLAPKAPANMQNQFNKFGGGGFNDGKSLDPSTQLLAELDKFGVTPIDFGYVALFIVIYILIVGPLDFFLLKFVFKRLEWTWITFPTVVLGVSVIAYFAAYALKGKDLKINKVDIVDFDLGTNRASPHAYGHSFFAILSPRIQNYTIGIEPNPQFWGETARKVPIKNDTVDEVLSADLMSWMGRPSGGPGDMGRSGSGGFFRKPYAYTPDASALVGVPIPVWTTKAFMASWEQPLTKAPFVADLEYIERKDQIIVGKLENHLGVDLVDCWIHYYDKFYLIEGGLKSVKNIAAPAKLTIAAHPSKDVREWVGSNNANDDAEHDAAANANQTRIVKQFLVHDRFDTQHTMRNHLLRNLDLSWRTRDEQQGIQRDRRTREAILFGRVRYPAGSAQTLQNDPQKPLPTKLWLGGIPDTGRTPQPLNGQLSQDTYVRVIIPVRPAQ